MSDVGSGLDSAGRVALGDELAQLREEVVRLRADAARRDRLAADLRERERWFRGFFQNAPLPYQSLDPDGVYLDVNQAFLDLLGCTREQVIGRPVTEFVVPEQHELLFRRFTCFKEDGEVHGVRFRLRGPDGRRVVVEVDGRIVRDEEGRVERTHCILHDVTRAEEVEDRLRRAQQMESVGRLAGGVAHDFNNLLTAILGYAEIGLEQAEGDVRASLECIRQAGDRAMDLTRQLLAFARRQLVEPRRVDLAAAVARIAPLLRRVLGEHVVLDTDVAEGTGCVRIDPSQLEQLLMNLAMNARDAMPRGGRLAIGARHVEVDEDEARRRPGLSAGTCVVTTVEDSGEGMTAEVLAHLFEPFYTTKGPGRGTGLGLATCYGIVKQAGGWIGVDSAPGRGTRFEVWLPLVDGTEDAPGRARPDAAPRGTGTLLLVEDEPLVREMTRRALADRGYAVLEAGDGVAALEVAARHDGPIDMLVTDLVMPIMGGKQLAQEIARVRPGIRVLFTSGYAEDVLAHGGVLDPGVALVRKPYAPSDLARRVKDVLASVSLTKP